MNHEWYSLVANRVRTLAIHRIEKSTCDSSKVHIQIYTIQGASRTMQRTATTQERLDVFVEEFLGTFGMEEPPINAFACAERLGLTVARDVSQASRGRIAKAGSTGMAVLLADEPRPERQQWTVAHEIGEHLAPDLLALCELSAADHPRMREDLANQFASRLLLPAVRFQEIGGQWDWDLLRLKGVFSTASHELIARRMLDFGPVCVITIFDHGRLSWRLGRQGRCCPLSHEERETQADVHRLSLARAWRGESLRVRGWPVHEPAWKREILRTESASWDD